MVVYRELWWSREVWWSIGRCGGFGRCGGIGRCGSLRWCGSLGRCSGIHYTVYSIGRCWNTVHIVGTGEVWWYTVVWWPKMV